MIKYKRNSKIYKPIENHSEYERTYCLAYQMCIRNKEVIDYVKEHNPTFDDFSCINMKKNEKIKKFTEYILFFITKDDLIETILNEDIDSKYKTILECIALKLKKTIVTEAKVKSSLKINNYEKLRINPEFKVLLEYVETKLNKKIETSFEYQIFLKCAELELNKIIRTSSKFKSLLEYNETYPLTEKNRFFKEVYSPACYVYDERTFSVNNIKFYPYRTVQTPYINKMQSKKRKITIDFALPLKEITSYLKAIQDNYNKDHSSINLNVKDTKEDSDNSFYDIRTPFLNQKKKPSFIKIKPQKTKGEQYADMFFIYDVLSTMTNTDEAIIYIQDQLSSYYIDMVLKPYQMNLLIEQYKKIYTNYKDSEIETKIKFEVYSYLTHIDVSTIKKYYKNLSTYIEEKKYKKLLL